MSSTREFICYPCGQLWHDEYTFWRGYLSPCPLCGEQCQAVCDTQVFADQQEMAGFYEAPLFDFREKTPEKTEADLEAERDLIHDEIVEALGAVEADMSDVDDSEADTDSEGAENGEGF
jgi:hypothetical protein